MTKHLGKSPLPFSRIGIGCSGTLGLWPFARRKPFCSLCAVGVRFSSYANQLSHSFNIMAGGDDELFHGRNCSRKSRHVRRTTKNDLHLTKETKLMSTNNTNKLANKVVGASTKAPNHSAKKSSGGWTPNPGASPGVRTHASNGSPRNGSFASSHAPSRSA